MARAAEVEGGVVAPVGRRIAVIGVTGSGKTTLARDLARWLGYPHVELDALRWEPNWTEAPREVFRARVARAIADECWVADGNYSEVRDLVWARADTVVWLDYALPLILWRLWWRTLRRVFTREKLWGKNTESWRTFVGRDSLFAWAIRTYPRRRREYPVLLRQPEHAHLAVVHLRSPREADGWLESVELDLKRRSRALCVLAEKG